MNRFPLKFSLVLLAISQVAYAEPSKPFVDLDFDAACKKAAESKKIIFIDFYTTWCGPCKLLDRTTWADSKVAAWLAEKTVALKVDCDKQAALAQRFSVQAYPTLVFAKPDGKEIGRILGYRPAEAFLAEAEAILAGKSPSSPPSPETLPGGANGPMARMQIADELASAGKHAEALKEYLWCFDEGGRVDPSFFGVRASFLLSRIHRLSGAYPPALEALKQRRDAAEQKLRAGDGEFQQAMDYASINREFQEQERTIALYDELRAGGDKTRRSYDEMKFAVADLLYDKRRYAEFLEANPAAMETLDQLIALNPPESGGKGFFGALVGGRPSRGKLMQDHVLQTGGRLFEAYLATDQREPATSVARKLLSYAADATTTEKLALHARRANREADWHSIRAGLPIAAAAASAPTVR